MDTVLKRMRCLNSMRSLGLVSVLLCSLVGVACNDTKTIDIATILPMSGASAAIGLALQRGVDIAVQQFAPGLGDNYVLAVHHIDETQGSTAIMHNLTTDSKLMGVIGPYDSTTAQALLPFVTHAGIATISPTNTLPGLTKPDQATAEGLAFPTLHPAQQRMSYFRLPEDDNALGQAAADLALAPTTANGVAAQSAFLVEDGTASGKTQAAAFAREFARKGGTVAGQQAIVIDAHDNAQAVTSAIIEAAPDVVFYGGSAAGGARLRATLSMTGAPHLPLIAGGQVANDPDWSAAVGKPAAAVATLALLPAPGPAALTVTAAQNFIMLYQAAYPNTDILPQTVMAYDAAMTEITALENVIARGKAVTRSAFSAALAQTHYAGLMGPIAFDQQGDATFATGFALYATDATGAWIYKTQLPG